MWRLRSNKNKASAQPTPASASAAADGFPGSAEELYAEIQRLTELNLSAPDRQYERRLLQLRHIAGIRLLQGAERDPQHPDPAFEHLPQAQGLPEIAPGEVTPELLRAGVLRDGCLLVRGLIDRDVALAFAEQIDRSFQQRSRLELDEPAAEGYYEEFRPEQRGYADLVQQRPWIKDGGGVLAIDSPMLAFEMVEMFKSAGVPDLVRGYLGEPALISAHKTTLRKADPSVGGAWHQDGAFMGPVRSMNLWLSLSRCGDEAPGLDLVPRRLDGLVETSTDEAMFPHMVSQLKAERAAGEKPIVRPIFEPGDGLFFDELFLHKTGSDPAMPNPRYAIENWFFGASAFPAEYAPVAV